MSEMPQERRIEILLVEDSEGDARLAMEALRASKIRNTIHHVWDGEEAMSFLRGEGVFAGVLRPDLVLLDLNLPKMNGREVLAEIKTDKDLKSIPVVILTASSAETDILAATDLNADCFITKPIELALFLEVVRSIEDFWLSIATLPDVATPKEKGNER